MMDCVVSRCVVPVLHCIALRILLKAEKVCDKKKGLNDSGGGGGDPLAG